jgi:hypothetical protein
VLFAVFCGLNTTLFMRKELTFLVITVTLHFSLRAQLSRNSWMIGGSLGFTSTSESGETITQFNIIPRAGYFFMDRLAAGLGVHATFDQTHVPYVSSLENYNDKDYGLGPFVRYYFLPVQKAVNVVMEVSDEYSWITAPYQLSAHSNTFGFAAGPTFFLTPSVALEWTVGYAWSRGGGSAVPTDAQTFNTTIGLQVYLRGKYRKG